MRVAEEFRQLCEGQKDRESEKGYVVLDTVKRAPHTRKITQWSESVPELNQHCDIKPSGLTKCHKRQNRVHSWRNNTVLWNTGISIVQFTWVTTLENKHAGVAKWLSHTRKTPECLYIKLRAAGRACPLSVHCALCATPTAAFRIATLVTYLGWWD